MQDPQKFEVQDKFVVIALREQVAELTNVNGVLKAALYQLQDQAEQRQAMLYDLEKARREGPTIGESSDA